MKFYNREHEMATLRSLQGGFCIAIVGRRRVGKTRLVRETYPDLLYLFVSEEKSERILAREWVERIRDVVYLPHLERVDDILEYLLRDPKRVVFIDEVQNLDRINPALLSRFQRIIDENKETAKVVVCGSYVSMMNRLFTSSKSPLFGRMDMVLKLEELSFNTIVNVGRDLGYGFEDSVVLYSLFGGMPKYYELVEKIGIKDIGKLVERLFFADTAPLRYEGTLVLRNEFGGEYRPYFSILEAIASGKSTLSEISNEIGIKPQTISKYIAALKDDFDLIERVVPVTETPFKSKKGRYFIKNNFYRFWFRNVHKNLDYFEEGRWDFALEKTIGLLPDHTGKTFEGLARDVVKKNYIKVGSWWNRRGEEIDIVALDEKKNEILFGEVKWRNRPMGWDVVKELFRKAELVQWRNYDRKERYLVVSKSGFTPKCLERMESEEIAHWTLEDIEKMIGIESS